MRVSVAITTFNHAPYIAQCIEGVLAQQTTFPIEVVVGDDGSTDGTRDILRDLQRRAPDRIRLVLPERNLGGGGNVLFMRILDVVRGAYVASMDGDDYWTAPHKLQRQVEFLDAHPECSMCFHNVLQVRQDGSAPPRRLNLTPPPPRLEIRDVIRQDIVIPACSPLFRRDVVCPLPEWYATMCAGDIPLCVLAAERGDIAYLDEVMGVYRLHAGGAWTGMASDSLRHESALKFREQLDAVTDRRYSPIIRPLVARTHAALAEAYGREGAAARARLAAWRALRAYPRGGEFSRAALLRVLVRGRM